MECSLCTAKNCEIHFRDERRDWDYWICHSCEFVFRDPGTYLSAQPEKERYATHNNSINDPRYVRFLSPALRAVEKYVTEGAQGLDYGCGPGPTLSEMIRRKNYSCVEYDPLFFADETLLQTTYDFVTCTEVVEHFYQPGVEFEKMNGWLRSGGHLVVMTDHRLPGRDFANWGYRTDITHVGFYNHQSWGWVARALGWRILDLSDRLAVFQKES